jgi:tetratricopeptide (TPR) repeat protein
MSVPNRALWILVVVVIACVSAAGYFLLRSPRPPQSKPGKTLSSVRPRDDSVQLPVHEPLQSEQEVQSLKQRELALAHRLMSDFPNDEEAFLQTANLHYRHGDVITASTYLQKALKINPRRADLYIRLANLSFKKGNLDEAITHYRQAIRLQPRFPEAHSNMAHAMMMLGRQEEAIEALQREIEVSPRASFAFFLLGQAYLQQKEYQKSEEYYEAAIKLKPQYSKAHYGLATVHARLGNREKAQSYSERFKELKTQERKGLKGRKIKYDDFVRTQKDAAITYRNVGRLYRKQARNQVAEELLKQAVGFDPNNINCLLDLGTLYRANREPANALQVFRRITHRRPEYPLGHFLTGNLLIHFEQWDEAERAFGKVILLAPKKSDGYRELARLYLKRRHKLPRARQLAEKAVSLETIASNYYVLGWAYEMNGDSAGALAPLKRALELDPGNENYQYLYNMVQQRK